MSMTADSLTSEINEATRAHYYSGLHDLDTALVRIQHGGFAAISREEAAEILRRPTTVDTVKALTGPSRQGVTVEQIAARRAEVTA